MTTTRNPAKVATALADAEAAGAKLSDWKAEALAAHQEADRLAANRPETPQDAARLAQERLVARERVIVATEGVQVAQRADLAARRAAVSAEADALDRPIAALNKWLTEHRHRTEDLLAPVVEHTGQAWAIPAVTNAEIPKRSELESLTRRQTALRAAARGEEPSIPVEELPDSLKAGGILPSEAALAWAERDAEAARLADKLAREQAELDAAVEVIGGAPVLAEALEPSGRARLEPVPEYQRLPESERWAFECSLEHYASGETLGELVDITVEQKDALLTIASLAGRNDATRCYRALRPRSGQVARRATAAELAKGDRP